MFHASHSQSNITHKSRMLLLAKNYWNCLKKRFFGVEARHMKRSKTKQMVSDSVHSMSSKSLRFLLNRYSFFFCVLIQSL